MNTKVFYLLMMAVLAAVGMRIWSKKDALRQPAPDGGSASYIIDNSTSQTINPAQMLTTVRSIMGRIDIGKHSRLTIYKLSEAANSYEPVPVISVKLEKGVPGVRKAMKEIEPALASIQPVKSSSIFRAVQVVLEQMQNMPGGSKMLVVQSDMEETVDDRLFRKRGKSSSILNNSGISTLMCGTAAASTGGPRGARADALMTIWRSSYKAPEQVMFQPFCSGQETTAAAR